ncbi:MAG: RraA family protein [Lachnospiraceae bacterium]|nr:RraA family protein [Lachnospiraceae bacterium]
MAEQNITKRKLTQEETRALVEKLRGFTTPELCDGMGVYRSMDYHIKPRAGREKIVGTAFTVDVPSGEGGIIADAILQLKEGDVMVIAGKGNCASSYWGDHRSICAKLMQAEAVIIDGACRDIEGCEEADFPLFARGITCGTAGKSGEGRIGVTVSCGGVSVSPGDLVVGDRNGVVVLRPEEAEAVMDAALDKRLRQEETIRIMRETGKILTKVIKK